MTKHQNPFRLNVGFIVHEEAGYSREFDFDFLTLHIHPDLDLYDFRGVAKISRTRQGLLVEMKAGAHLPAECVRCLDPFEQALSTAFTELYAFDERSTDEAELTVPENGIIDLEPLVREYMLLAMPSNPICRPDCAGLCPVCGNNRNYEPCDHEVSHIDPRMAALRKLLEDNEDTNS